MENENMLEQVIEAILFASGEPVSVLDLTTKLEVSSQKIKTSIEKIKERFSGDSGIVLKTFGDKYQLASNSKYTEDVSLVLNPIRERALSKSTIETLAIIAYKQPVTRLEIEEVRGVSSDYAVGVLMDHKLIEIVGKKDVVGRPVMFGTTDEFLKRFNLQSIEDLPDKNDLLDRIKTIRSADRDQSLYRQFDISSEEIVPDQVKEKYEQDKKELAEIIENEKKSLGITSFSTSEDDGGFV